MTSTAPPANGVPLVVFRLPRGALAALIVNPAGLAMQAIATAELNARPVRMGGIEKKNIMMQPRKSLLACLFGGNCTVHAHPAHNLYPYTWPDIVCSSAALLWALNCHPPAHSLMHCVLKLRTLCPGRDDD